MFPTLDGKVVAGPTAVDQEDKDDWSVRPEAAARDPRPRRCGCTRRSRGREPVAAYAGLRPAGPRRNYVIGVSAACARLVNVAAIRSTGLTASLGIAEHVAGLVADAGRARSATPAPLPRRAAGALAARSLVAADSRVPGGGMSRPLLLGIDEGTSAVKAVLYDTDLKPRPRRAGRSRSRTRARVGWSRTRRT